MSPALDGFETRHSMAMPNFGMCRGRAGESKSLHRPHDWHTVERETLVTSTDTHEITFSRTRIDSYAHQVGRGHDQTLYDVRFVNLHDRNQTAEIRESTAQMLAEIFADIVSKVTRHTPPIEEQGRTR